MDNDLILEIGTEELPAGFIPRALSSLEGFLRKNLESSRLTFAGIRTLGTPRRLTLIVEGLSERQPDSTLEVRGPQKKAAYMEDGSPTPALLGFTKAQGVDIKDLRTVTAGKAEYILATRHVKGEETLRILPEVLRDTVSQDFFPKSMRWGSHEISFARPVHWILSVYGGKTVEFQWGHLKGSDETFGHRFLGPKGTPIKVTEVKGYIEGLRKAYVIIDPDERKRVILEGLEKEARAAGGNILPDEGLLEEVSYLVEYPVVVRGSFGDDFLEIPRDIIINAMREHQRYFSVIGPDGALLPCFLTVANTKAADMDVVRKGNERVLRARLNDAKFYYLQDTKKRLADRVESLKGVVFQARLGTSYEKVERFTELALYIGASLGFSRPPEGGERPSDFLTDSLNPASYDPSKTDPGLYSKYVLGRAAMLSKADLTSGVVGEFPKLQGVMGSIYARRDKEVPEVSAAIYEHYLPTVSGGALPASLPGSIVSIADKLDTITGCFGVGLTPTGAQDPYALRRQSLGIIAIILEKGLRIRLDDLVDEALRLLGPKLTRDRNDVKEGVLEFIKDRLKNMLLSQSISFDSVDAVLSAQWFDIVDAVNRARAIEDFKRHPACPTLVTAFKRVSNILKSASLPSPSRGPDAALFTDREERELYDISMRISPRIEDLWKKGDHKALFETLASIKEKIDAFFDHVMVMVEDARTRENRLLLLNSVRDLYFRIADLSRLTV